ncbi:hypothetical protein II906_12535, partial [bacterium]|nr:hypothetical protein [bacterium]
KFFPELQNGAFLYTTKTINDNFAYDNLSYLPKKMSFKEICENEALLDNEDIKLMSECSNNIFNKIDLETKRKEFQEHFSKAEKLFEKKNLLKIKLSNETVPFKYPYLAEDRREADETVKELEIQGLTIYRYWNNLPKSFTEYAFYERLIAL